MFFVFAILPFCCTAYVGKMWRRNDAGPYSNSERFALSHAPIPSIDYALLARYRPHLHDMFYSSGGRVHVGNKSIKLGCFFLRRNANVRTGSCTQCKSTSFYLQVKSLYRFEEITVVIFAASNKPLLLDIRFPPDLFLFLSKFFFQSHYANKVRKLFVTQFRYSSFSSLTHSLRLCPGIFSVRQGRTHGFVGFHFVGCCFRRCSIEHLHIRICAGAYAVIGAGIHGEPFSLALPVASTDIVYLTCKCAARSIDVCSCLQLPC